MAKGQTPLESLLQDLRQAEIETDGLFDDSAGVVQQPLQQSLIAWSVEHAPKVFPGWELDEPARLMLEVIQEALEGKDQRVLLCPSARSGKTTCLILGLVWALYRWPTGAPQLLISSTQRHASNVAKKTIALFRASGGRLHPKSKSSQEWAPNWADGLTSQVVIIGRTTSALVSLRLLVAG